MSSRRLSGAVLAFATVMAACSATSDTTSSSASTADGPADLARSGGDATVDEVGPSAFALGIESLDREQRRAFAVGNNFFNDNWVTAPASTTARDGLGPLFNAQSCSSCHFKDGRGAPMTVESPEERGLLLRLSVPGDADSGGRGHGAPVPNPAYGGQLQDRAINGVPVEGSVRITTREIRGTFEDGTPYTLEAPEYSVAELGYGPLGPETMIGPRIAPPVFGDGLLEAVPEEMIRDLAEQQADEGAVSGRPNLVWSPSTQAIEIGRFGWKANVASVADQSAGAFLGDIGITSRLHRDQDCTPLQLLCLAAPNGGDPEISDEKLDRVIFYTRTLAVPARRDVGERSTSRGEQSFGDLGCSACHVSQLRTGRTDVDSLSDQDIRPYTDLLLHDMGEALADDRPDFAASGSEWRTAPLWGIGLTDEVNGHTRFLHDGRARNLTEAILWHGGEAQFARDGFLRMSADERDDLIAFLNSL